jgi:hypothetical protein
MGSESRRGSCKIVTNFVIEISETKKPFGIPRRRREDYVKSMPFRVSKFRDQIEETIRISTFRDILVIASCTTPKTTKSVKMVTGWQFFSLQKDLMSKRISTVLNFSAM